MQPASSMKDGNVEKNVLEFAVAIVLVCKSLESLKSLKPLR